MSVVQLDGRIPVSAPGEMDRGRKEDGETSAGICAVALDEATLRLLWKGQSFPPSALVTRQGVTLRVLHPGRAGRGPGPDFRDALLETPSGAAVRGDVELHVLASSFRSHGHHRDGRYDRVILHVVFEDDEGEDTLLASGRRAPVVALGPWVGRRAQDLAARLALPARWREPCHDARVRLGERGLIASLEALGERRLGAKRARLQKALAEGGPEQALYEGLLRALGYGGNEEAMLLLARRLPWWELRGHLQAAAPERRRETAEALLLGTAGLLPAQRCLSGRRPKYAQLLEAVWEAHQRPALSPERWRPWGVRPGNQPARRLAGAAALLARHLSDLLAPPRELLSVPQPTTAGLLSPWTAPAEGYWHRYLDLCGAPCPLPIPLIGRGRALEIVVNVVLPTAMLLAEGGRDHEAARRLGALFARLPRAGPYGATRFLEEALRDPEGRPLELTSLRQQGLLHLHRAYCTRGACGHCPLS